MLPHVAMLCHLSELLALLPAPLGGIARPALTSEFFRHVDRASRRYPESYFDMGQRDEHALHSLNHDLLYDCEHRVIRGRPWAGRTPFVFFVANGSSDAEVCKRTFYDRFSLLRIFLARGYASNLKHDVSLRTQKALWKSVSRAVRRCARPTGVLVGRYPTWQLDPSVRIESAIEVLVAEALSDGPRTQARVVEAVRPRALALLPAESPPAGVEAADDEDRAAVHEAVRRVWLSLDAETRTALTAVVECQDLAEVFAWNPKLIRPPAMTRFVARIDALFLNELVDVFERAPDVDSELGPRDLFELIYAVLLEIGQREPRSRRAEAPLGAPLPALPPSTPPPTPEEWDEAEVLWSALRHPGVARTRGLGATFLARLGAVAWQAEPSRDIAAAELDEGLWIDLDESSE